MARITGTLILDLLESGAVLEVFTPHYTSGTAKPLEAKNIEAVEDDLASTFGLTGEDAAARVAELKRVRHLEIEIECDVEAAVLPRLCVVRGVGA